MARTKAKGRRGPEGHQFRENNKTPDGRALNKEQSKRKHEEQKASRAAKETPTAPQEQIPQKPPQEQTTQPAPVNPPSPTAPSKEATPTQQHVSRLLALLSAPPTAPSKEAARSTPPATTDPPIVKSSSPAPTAQAQSTNTTIINPLPLIKDLESTHDVTTLSILSSTPIQQKVSRILALLSAYPPPLGSKPAVVVLYAKAAVAAKLISIVEIAKRDIDKSGGKWFQYSAVSSRLEERKAGGVDGGEKGGDVDMGDEAEGEEEEGFEAMKTPFERAIEGNEKVRAVPIIAVYISRVRIDSLRKAHREQTNGLPFPQK